MPPDEERPEVDRRAVEVLRTVVVRGALDVELLNEVAGAVTAPARSAAVMLSSGV
ncbi:MAG: hypothetical protein ACJ79X_15885 [Gemmatimonadaceae bacterium]